MKKLIVGGLAALAIGLAAAPVAGADCQDRAFIKATDKVISGVRPLAGPDGLDRISPRFLLSSGSTPLKGCAPVSMMVL